MFVSIFLVLKFWLLTSVLVCLWSGESLQKLILRNGLLLKCKFVAQEILGLSLIVEKSLLFCFEFFLPCFFFFQLTVDFFS
jgi:hypothetical protein